MKRIVICCDGTWNRADQEHESVPCPTNVVKTAYRVAKRDAQGVAQTIYYDQGVGTGNTLDRLSGGAFGKGLEDNILDVYRFLIANYEDGDEIFLFGFSRGAFTARSIGGMMRKCGILKREAVAQYRAARNLYHSETRPDQPAALEFRQKHSVCPDSDIPVKFIGVWDTVGALGIPLRGLRFLTRRDHQFHDTELSGTVKFAYHALSVDEHRAPFEPTLWKFKPKPGQWVEQVWFAGVHSDVGGGYPETGASDVALEWMLGKARDAGLGLDAGVMAALPLKPDPTRGPLHDSKTGMYNLTRGIDRPIGGDPTQSVHPSVLARWDADSSYRPKNLRAWFAATGDPRAKS
jgi:uncharacterized protein (DUF2235 family)